MTTASSGPPPTVPAIDPSGATSIFAPASRGAERAVDVTVHITNGSRAADRRAASWNSSRSVIGGPNRDILAPPRPARHRARADRDREPPRARAPAGRAALPRPKPEPPRASGRQTSPDPAPGRHRG